MSLEKMWDTIRVGLFYGSDTGNTDAVTSDLIAQWSKTPITAIEACDMTISDYDRFDFIFIGLSTWYDGDLQSDFEDFFEDFKLINFTDKVVALYGLGDQYGYAEYFVDGLGILGKVIEENGGKIIGLWPCDGYDYLESKAQYSDSLFYGLALDDDNEVHMTPHRLKKWLAQVENELTVELEKKAVPKSA